MSIRATICLILMRKALGLFLKWMSWRESSRWHLWHLKLLHVVLSHIEPEFEKKLLALEFCVLYDYILLHRKEGRF